MADYYDYEDYDDYDYDDYDYYDDYGDEAVQTKPKQSQVSQKKAGSRPGSSQSMKAGPAKRDTKSTQGTASAPPSQANSSSGQSDGARRKTAGSVKTEGSAAANSVPPYQDPANYEMPQDLRKALDAHGGGKQPLHVVVLGHVDAGKSTLMGRLLHDLGHVDDRAVRKNQQAAQAAGKASFGWAWVMDERDEERERGVTVDISMRRIQTDKYAVTLLDAPGHLDFVPNLITGVAQADAALLVVDGAPGGFEAGFGKAPASHGPDLQPAGQTREHVHVARSAGIKQLIVVVTKLDVCDYKQERFQEIQGKLGPFLKSCGYSKPEWLPVSAPDGQNVSNPPTDDRLLKWWADGKTLVAAIDSFEPVTQNLNLPFRMVITDIVKQQSLHGSIGVCGKIQTGAVVTGQRILIMPAGSKITVKDLQVLGKSQPVASAGDSVDIGLSGVDETDLDLGSTLCHPEYPVKVSTRIQARVLVVHSVRPIIAGQSMVLHMHSTSSPCRIAKILSLLDHKTGEVTRSAPVRMLLQDQAADVEVSIEHPTCLEVFPCSTSLGRFVLRMNGRLTALGSVKSVLDDSPVET